MGPSTVVGLSRQALVTTLVVVMKGRIRDTEKGGGDTLHEHIRPSSFFLIMPEFFSLYLQAFSNPPDLGWRMKEASD